MARSPKSIPWQEAEPAEPGNKKLHIVYYILAFIIVNMILFFLITSRPRFSVTMVNSSDAKSVDIRITKKSFYPLKSFSLKLDEEPLPYTREGNVYTAHTEKNGTLELVAVNLNTMSQTIYERVDGVDETPPEMVGQVTAPGVVNVSFEDTQSDIDFEQFFGIDSNGHRIPPATLNAQENTATFRFTTDALEIHIADTAGNSTQVLYENERDITAYSTFPEGRSQGAGSSSKAAEEESSSKGSKESSSSQRESSQSAAPTRGESQTPPPAKPGETEPGDYDTPQ